MMARHRSLFLVALLARLAGAQATDTTHRASGAVVSGVVRDSIARAPLAGAMVELVAADSPARFARTAFSDSLGRFVLTDVPNGRHKLGFFHPLLDSLGVEAPLREVYVSGEQMIRADLAIPSPERLRAAFCGRRSAADSGGVIIGTVRDALNGMPAPDVTVTAEWIELSFRRDRVLHRNIPRRVTKTGDNGWFAICSVPNGGSIALLASRDADSTDIIEVSAPAIGFLRQDIFLGLARNVVTPDAVQPLTLQPGTAATSSHRVRAGDGVLRGTVVASDNGLPLTNAQVGLAEGPQTRSNERGEWTLVNVPAGSRMLDVRALGYYPDRRRVDVVAGVPAVHVELSTLEAVLDTVKVRASRVGKDPSGFAERRKSGIGHFYTQAEIVKWKPVVLSDFFRQVPGVQVEFVGDGFNRRISIRGSFGRCDPAIYLNGQPMTSLLGVVTITLTADDLDTWVRPHDVTGIEVYTGETTPIQYQQGQGGCGSILIWTKLSR